LKTYKGRMPFPPTLNHLFVNLKSGGRAKSKDYAKWEKLADTYGLLTPRVQFEGPVRVEYVFHRPDKRRRDVANLEKAVSDTLQRWGIVADDCQIEHLTLRWASSIGSDGVQAGEVAVTVQELEKAP
jgi:crossover junction endodeoxyribonuclease RusA